MPLVYPCTAADCDRTDDYRHEAEAHQSLSHPGEKLPEIVSEFREHRNVSGRPLREMMCRGCASWCSWHENEGAQPSGPDGRWDPEADGSWSHTADGSPMCIPFDVLAPRPAASAR